MANPNNHWSQFYNNQTTSTTTATTTSTSADSPVNPESRRVSKPTRRRSRASRRTPTTLLNTDTANFRAMVQQFTGGPSALAFGSPSSGFSLTSSGPTAGASYSGYQYANIQNQVAHHEVLQQQRQYMVPSSNHVSTHLSYPNTVVSDGFLAVDESRDGGRGGGRGYAPSSEMNSNITTSWMQ
ncbi:VQ motif-containing protein [Raphanus sativus]|uniref:VQ motif-containing protein 22 n=1 Tax=Raphanus sativus TaxID=3726 RepID=A0A6J0M919_RAPSA|nr:VQ motif-containing protein 22 [Raphanus sativus]KAJ4912307.1 VQ motif-containing protein [Raphanus sativus]